MPFLSASLSSLDHPIKHTNDGLLRSESLSLQPPHFLSHRTPYLYIAKIPPSPIWQTQAPWLGFYHLPIFGLVSQSPTLWLTILLFPFGRYATNSKALILICPFLIHYLNRTCIYPLRLYLNTAQHNSKTACGFPVSLALMAFGFNLLNAYLQARWVSHYKEDYDSDGWFWWRFLGGLLVFFWGMWINIWSDRILVGLKRQGGGYKVPRGGWFELVSCPSYFGEIVEWLGWAVMPWSWVGFGMCKP